MRVLRQVLDRQRFAALEGDVRNAAGVERDAGDPRHAGRRERSGHRVVAVLLRERDDKVEFLVLAVIGDLLDDQVALTIIFIGKDGYGIRIVGKRAGGIHGAGQLKVVQSRLRHFVGRADRQVVEVDLLAGLEGDRQFAAGVCRGSTIDRICMSGISSAILLVIESGVGDGRAAIFQLNREGELLVRVCAFALDDLLDIQPAEAGIGEALRNVALGRSRDDDGSVSGRSDGIALIVALDQSIGERLAVGVRAGQTDKEIVNRPRGGLPGRDRDFPRLIDRSVVPYVKVEDQMIGLHFAFPALLNVDAETGQVVLQGIASGTGAGIPLHLDRRICRLVGSVAHGSGDRAAERVHREDPVTVLETLQTGRYRRNGALNDGVIAAVKVGEADHALSSAVICAERRGAPA